MIRIHGTVTDFHGNPIPGASVELKKNDFQIAYGCLSDEKGHYELSAEDGKYIALAAIVPRDYRRTKLEYWAWNVPASSDLQINPRYDALEIYAMNAWMPQGALPSLQIYFRPMSLKRVLDQGGLEAIRKMKLVDIAPDLSPENIQVRVGEEPVPALEVNKVREAGPNGQAIFAYLIQTRLPGKRPAHDIWRITLTAEDPETGEMGENLLFWEKPRYV
jgi:hypothetical protein